MEKNRYFKSVLKGTIGSIILCFIGITILSALMMKFEFSKEIFNSLYVIISLLSLTLGAITGAKNNQSKGWLVGLGVAIGYYLSLFVIFSALGSISFGIFDFAKFCIALVVGTLSGMLGINL